MPTTPNTIRRVVEAAARAGVDLRVLTFAEPTHTAQQAAQAVGAEVGQIVKSLVFVVPRGDRAEPCLVLASGASNVDVDRLAAVLGEPAVRRATADEARRLTGFVIGGIPPFGHSAAIRTVMDPNLLEFETVWAAAGTATAVFEIEPHTLRTLTDAIVAPIATGSSAATPT